MLLTHFNDPKDSFSLLSTLWRHHLKHHKEFYVSVMLRWNAANAKSRHKSKFFFLLLYFCLFASLVQKQARMKWIWGLLIAVHKRSLCVMKKSLGFFELNLKWIQIMFFAATRRVLCCFQFLCFFFFDCIVQQAQCVMREERKLKFQIVYNYFSINCHTLHTSFQIQSKSCVVSSLLGCLNYGRNFLARYLFLCFFGVRN